MIKNLKNKKKKGFTLIELIIVIAIIAILAAIAIPQFSNIRKKANINTDVANARTISSIIAAEVADEKIDANVSTLTEVGEFNGNLNPVPVPKAYKGVKFFYKVVDGDVEIYVAKSKDATGNNVIEIYPERDSNYGNGSEPVVKTQSSTGSGSN